MATKLVGAYAGGDGPNTDLEFLATRCEECPVPAESECRDAKRVPIEFPRGTPGTKIPEGYVAIIPSTDYAMTILGKDTPRHNGVIRSLRVRMIDLVETPSIGVMCVIPQDAIINMVYRYLVGEQHRIVGAPGDHGAFQITTLESVLGSVFLRCQIPDVQTTL